MIQKLLCLSFSLPSILMANHTNIDKPTILNHLTKPIYEILRMTQPTPLFSSNKDIIKISNIAPRQKGPRMQQSKKVLGLTASCMIRLSIKPNQSPLWHILKPHRNIYVMRRIAH